MVSYLKVYGNKSFEDLLPKERNALNFDIASHAARPLIFLFSYIRRYALSNTVILVSVLSAVACGLLSQYAIKNMIDILSQGHEHVTGLLTAFLVLIGLISADNILWRIAGWVGARVFAQVAGDLRRDLFGYIGGHSAIYFFEHQPGMLASRITAAANAVYITENMFTWNIIPPCIAVSGSIIMVVTVNPVMAASLLLVSSILSIILYQFARQGMHQHRVFAAHAAAVDGELVDMMSNMSLIRAFGMILQEQKRFASKVHEEVFSRTRSIRYLEKVRILHAITTIFLSAALLGWALTLWNRGEATSGDIVLVSSLGFTILHGTRDLAVALVDVTQHIARLAEALETLLQPHSVVDTHDALDFKPSEGQVRFDQVKFAYPRRNAILSDFSLIIKSGQRVGLIGRSGAGKSTVFALLQRFYSTQGGAILIDDKNIQAITQTSLNKAIALVPQDISLLHRTIFENIQYGRFDAPKEAVYSAAREAHCYEFIEALPDGFDTIVGDRGVKLSGGQRQRIAIARAILKDAPILLLDEATSALDSESEETIQKALDRLMYGRTVIAIAHRLSTLQNFDRIVVMDQGKIIDDGPPEMLRDRPGLYRELLVHQVLVR